MVPLYHCCDSANNLMCYTHPPAASASHAPYVAHRAATRRTRMRTVSLVHKSHLDAGKAVCYHAIRRATCARAVDALNRSLRKGSTPPGLRVGAEPLSPSAACPCLTIGSAIE